MTFSIAARCAETGQFGIAISSSSIAVGARCPWLQPGIGAVSSQNITLPALGPRTLEGLAQGLAPETALAASLASDGYADYRQVTVIDAQGRSAHHSGAQTLGVHHARSGRDCVAAGNMLATTAVVDALVDSFQGSQGALAERLLLAMQAALAAGGEAGPVHSAALLVVGEPSWPIVNLRVDWAETDPIGQLADLWRAYQPQLQDYLDRAVRPDLAPGYGVPGDDR
ncbi:major pilin protein fimA [Pseudomonas oryzihabitans]|nr:major pilin protein fimA [Pseudomonas psychrotolerans]